MLHYSKLRVLISGIALASLALGCGREEDPVAGTEQQLPADQIMTDVQYDVRDVGVLRARLFADTAYMFEDSAKLYMRPVHLMLFNEEGEQVADLTSREGTMDTRTRAMEARGNVVLVATDGNRRVETEELHYDPGANLIWSDVATVYHEGDTRIDGDGFTSDGQMRNVQVKGATAENLPIKF
jgi:LPS export ABC transporter protein LptC